MQTTENARWEIVVDFEDDEEEGEEDISADMIILQKVRGAIVAMKFAHCEMYNEISQHFVKSNFNSTETVIRIINELLIIIKAVGSLSFVYLSW